MPHGPLWKGCSMKKAVLVDPGTAVISPSMAVEAVQSVGLKQAAETFGVSVSTLSKFLGRNGYKSQRETKWVQEPETAPAPPELVA